METGNKNREKEALKRKMELVKDIAVESASSQLADPRTYQFAAGIGLYQGLKYKGNLGQGLKAGLAGLLVVTGCNVVVNLVRKYDDIKNA
jgi:hypothetical protein